MQVFNLQDLFFVKHQVKHQAKPRQYASEDTNERIYDGEVQQTS